MGMPGFLSQRSREIDPHLEMRSVKWGSSGVVPVQSRGNGYVGELLELPQGCQGPFWGSRGKVGFLSRLHSGKEPHLSITVESPRFSRVAAGNLDFFSDYDGDLREPLMLPQETQVSMWVARGLSGFLSSRCRVLSPYLQVRKQTSGFLSMLTWISGSYGVSGGELGFVSCGDMQILFPLEL